MEMLVGQKEGSATQKGEREREDGNKCEIKSLIYVIYVY